MVDGLDTLLGDATATIDGNEAAARIAHVLSEIVVLYPITPASPMGELVDEWSGEGRPNLWGGVPDVVEMQSEAGAAGALHGAAMKGALATTFTASQGLLLMLPNMYKMAGELTPAVIHVAARAVATHALSIFGDHSDVMAARSTGWPMLAASSVQEAHDFALVAHAATLRSRLPFLHFFDGFRTSHEIDKINLLSTVDVRALVREQDILAHRARALSPDHPTLRGSAQNPDVFFQGREAANRFYAAVPRVVQEVMDELSARTGRAYHLADYEGAADADRVIVLMGSGVGAVQETVDELNRRGERVGLLKLRLFRPFPADDVVSLLPDTVRRVAVLDRTKEPGAVGDPLYLDVVSALYGAGRRDVDVVAGRYGLGSKEFTPSMVKSVFDELAAASPRRQLTVGIADDVTGSSVSPDVSFRAATRAVSAVFFGLGSDGTVGANKATIKLIGELTDLYAQGYFVYDSRKSGSVTVSHLRFGPDPIRSTYLVDRADFVACHQFNLLRTEDVLSVARQGATFLLNTPYPADEVWDRLPAAVQRQILDKRLDVWVINAGKVARAAGMGNRINTVMQPCFFALSNVIPREQALEALKESIVHRYAKRGPVVVQRNLDAVSRALDELVHLDVPLDARVAPDGAVRPIDRAPELTRDLVLGRGNELPVSQLPVDGVFATGTAQWEKRAIGTELPIWDPSLCIDCGKCAIVCPHAAVRMKAFDPSALDGAPEGFKSKDCMGRDLPGMKLTVQVSPDDCTGCGLCVEICPAHSKEAVKHKSLNLEDALEHRDEERPNWEFFSAIPEFDRTAARLDTVKGSQLLQPLFEFSGACAGCGETPYLKLLSQLFGDRMVVANATGCSSIYGGNLPTTPWARNSDGRGPAWANSLFEDNAEFGLGLRLAYERQVGDAQRLLDELRDVVGDDLATSILEADQSTEAGIGDQRRRVARLKAALHDIEAADHDQTAARLLSLADELVSKSFWIVGGDGWAYDIGFGGLDHVLGSGRDVNVLVLDTEVYSNTGGQASKSTPRAAVAKFASSGKSTAKKDLGAFARSYGNVYVAQIALGANEMQTVRALREAAAWPGPSLVIAYSTCIAHGIEMSTSMSHQKDAVSAGYWPLYRYHPSPEPGAHPFQLDSKAPSKPLDDFVAAETRFAILQRSDPERAARLLALAQSDVDERWRYYQGLAEVARVLPHDKEPTPVATNAEEESE
ncbi:MAG TPA: pyruvate:ferredoxin (flavodoxin) oxidoreductase [Acidothermaceae bacterium]